MNSVKLCTLRRDANRTLPWVKLPGPKLSANAQFGIQLSVAIEQSRLLYVQCTVQVCSLSKTEKLLTRQNCVPEMEYRRVMK